ncbi:hypothetical protein FD754_005253 [Muntiacus muntjak]|uniref:Sodium channel and clathrin linker 1 n=1 Tax=Muntiacus muntjak TaxID=9888 RepID=A0A5N3WJE7_MUNMU|nr:hypothetical protein FD754_005253 [Muntiacus muntjak]
MKKKKILDFKSTATQIKILLDGFKSLNEPLAGEGDDRGRGGWMSNLVNSKIKNVPFHLKTGKEIVKLVIHSTAAIINILKLHSMSILFCHLHCLCFREHFYFFQKVRHQKKVKLDSSLIAHSEVTSRLIKDLQVKVKGAKEKAKRKMDHINRITYSLRICFITLLSVAINEATQLRAERTHLEKQTRALQAKCSELEAEKYEAIVRARNSMQLLEDANLQRNKALLEDKQKQEEIEKMKETVSQIVQDAAVRTKKVIVNTRKQYNVQISQLTEELSALQMQCAEKQDQIERAIREKKAVEEELEKIYREGRINENDYRKLEEMHQRCLVAERSKDDLQLRLKTAENKIKQLEINSSEEISRCQEMIQKLQNILESERENCGFVNEQRLKLQQENEELQKQTEDLRKSALEAQKKAKLKISTMEHEFSIKEHGFEVQLREMEDSNRNSTVELRHLLATTQKAANRWKEETKKLTESAEIRISNLNQLDIVNMVLTIKVQNRLEDRV